MRPGLICESFGPGLVPDVQQVLSVSAGGLGQSCETEGLGLSSLLAHEAWWLSQLWGGLAVPLKRGLVTGLRSQPNACFTQSPDRI